MLNNTANKIDPKKEIVELVTNRGELFVPKRKIELRQVVSELVHTYSSFALPNHSDAEYVAIASSGNLDEVESARLQIVCHIAEAEYYKRQNLNSHRNACSEDEESEDSSDEFSAENSEEEDGEEGNAEKIKKKLKEYTFAPELKNKYHSLLDHRPIVLILHTRTIFIKEKASNTWDNARDKIKSVLSAMGLEGVFIALDYAAKRSKFVNYSLKCLGSIVVPIFLLYSLVSMALRFLTNPFKHVLNWLAREFDIKTESDPSTD